MSRQDISDLQNKFSKKIAQLTKVIFLLNTRNDENDNSLKHIAKTYEQEMDSVVSQANEVLRKYKESAEKASNMGELEKSYEAYKGKIEGERTKSVMEFNNFKNTLQDKERSIQQEVDRKVNVYKQEIEHMKSKFETLQKALQKLTENSDSLKNTHQKELGDYVKEQNEKYNILLKQKMDLEDKLEDKNKKYGDLEKKFAEMEARYKEEIKNLKSTHQKSISDLSQDYDKKLRDLESELKKSDGKNKILEDENKNLKKKIEDLNFKVQALEKELQDYRNLSSTKGSEVEMLKKRISDQEKNH